MKKVEQITWDNEIVSDYDVRLPLAGLRETLSRWFTLSAKSNPFSATYNGHPVTICVKQITYLGHPHDVYKKRIQIPKEWKSALQGNKVLLLGIYRYKENTVIAAFDPTKYRSNRLNNSSAHIHTIDIKKAMEFGVFSKIDSKGNHITVCRADKFAEFLDSFFGGQAVQLPAELDFLDKFANTIPKKWAGKDCYAEMIAARYRNARQSEWPGFYFEYLFEKYSNDNPYTKRICVFVVDKSETALDFDLNFADKFLGDLKCHSEDSSGILGNDKWSVDEAISQYGRLWYVVLSHSTEKDSSHGYVVTEYWNNALGKENKRSYGKRMKHSVQHNSFQVLEINKANRKHASDFRQGHQPSGGPREIKIKISNRAIDNFLIYKKTL